MTPSTRATMHRRKAFAAALLLAVAAWPGTVAFAASEKPRSQRSERYRADTQKPLQEVRPRKPASCSEFGAGFVRMPGSDSCMRFGGGVGVGVGGVP